MRIKERFLICLNKEIILIIQRKRGFEVTPRSSVEIEKLTEKVRLFAQAKGCVDPSGYLDVVRLMEEGGMFSNQENGSYLDVVDDNELSSAFAQTLPNGIIRVRESIYNNAIDGNGHARFTIAHEIGHFIMHRKQMHMARKADDDTKIYCDSEWQADEFAGRLLVPTKDLKQYSNIYTADEIAERYGVSASCAEVRLRKCK